MNTIQPRIKPTVKVNRVGESLCFRTSGNVTEIEDKNSILSNLVDHMDGKRNLSELSSILIKRHPELTQKNIEGIVKTLDEIYLLEDGRADSIESSLNLYDQQRWQRNINFFGSFCKVEESKYTYQEKLKGVKVALLGLGGLGSHILFDLAAMGVHDIHTVEFDKVEISNLNRQILYKETDVGKLKAKVAEERIRSFNSQINIKTHPYKMTCTNDVRKAIKGRDIVICVADRPKMEILNWVNEACVKERVPLITGGLDTQRALYYSMIPGQTGCIACWRNQVQSTDPFSDQVLVEQRRTQMGGDNAAFVTFVSIITGFMLTEFVKIVTGLKAPQAAGQVLTIHFDDMRVEATESWTKIKGCEVCGSLD